MGPLGTSCGTVPGRSHGRGGVLGTTDREGSRCSRPSVLGCTSAEKGIT